MLRASPTTNNQQLLSIVFVEPNFMSEVTIPILLVEDSPSDAGLVRQVLLRSGRKEWELVCVERLSEAIALCREQLFAVVLLDLALPDSDREDTVPTFCAAVPDIPVVVLTGADDEELGLQAMACGAQDYLVKDKLTVQMFVRTIRFAIERGQVFKQLRESERRFRAIFNQTFQLTALLQPDGIVLEVNQTALTLIGIRQTEVLGRPFWETRWWSISRETQNQLQAALQEAAQGKFIRYEVDILADRDIFVTIDFSIKPFRDEQGEVALLIAEGRDISDRKRAEAEVIKALEKERELNQLKTGFVSMVSHEFRTPMTTIQSAAGMIQRYYNKLNEEKKIKYFTQIDTAISSMLQLLDEVLFLGRTDADLLKYQPAPLDLENFCRELAENMQISNSRQSTITFTCEGEPINANIDAFLLQVILTNLLSNAIKYSPQRSNIHFHLTYQNATARFQIQDQGIGIPIKDQAKLFETFHRASNVGNIQGTGLGLSIVKKCVELHNGQITLESKVDQGTTITVTLPTVPTNTLS